MRSRSHLNRLHTQRHAILSLVESVDLVKKGPQPTVAVKLEGHAVRTNVSFAKNACKTPSWPSLCRSQRWLIAVPLWA